MERSHQKYLRLSYGQIRASQSVRDNNSGTLIVVDVYASFEDLGNPDSLYDDDELHLSSEVYDYWNQWVDSALDDADACVIWQSNSCIRI